MSTNFLSFKTRYLDVPYEITRYSVNAITRNMWFVRVGFKISVKPGLRPECFYGARKSFGGTSSGC